MAKYFTMSGQSFTLGASISSTQTSILLTSFKVPVTGTNITMTTMNTSIAYGTLAPGTSSAELISFTGVSQAGDGTATLTGVTRGLDKEYPYTEDSDFKQPHAGQTIFILSDAPQVFNSYPAKVNSETISGQWTFPTGGTASAALVGATYVAPVQNNEIATKKYIDDIAISGSPDATTSVKGIIQLPTQAQSEAGTATGSTSATLVVTNAQYGARYISGYATTTGSVNIYAVDLNPTPTTLFTGMLVGFNITTANTGNATLNVDTLGAKNILLGGTGLFAGALATGTNIGVEYNGTQYDVIWRSQGESASATANKLALRNTLGDLAVNTTPTNSTDATSKAYVDSLGTGFITSSGTTVIPVANTTQNVATMTVAGGILSTNKGVRIRVITKIALLGTNGGATFALSYGGTQIASWALTGVSGTPTETDNINADVLLMGAGTTGTQITNSMVVYQLQSGSAATRGNTADIITSSIDSTTDKNLLLSLASNSANATGTLVGYFVEKIT